jgi:membrane fusion protein, multidrug efflux system
LDTYNNFGEIMDEKTRITPSEYGPEPILRDRTIPRPTKTRSALWRALGLVVVIGLPIGAYEAFQTAPTLLGRPGRAPRTAPQPVGAATIGKGDIRIIVDALGTVTPLATVTVMTQINGQLTEVGFKEGQMLKKGDFLAQIDQRPFQALEQQAEGQLVHDQGLLDEARMDLTRFENLTKTQAIPRQQAEDQVYLVKQAEGSVKTDQAQIETQKINIIYCHIVSPVDGRVGLRLVDPGNFVQTTNSSGIAVITQLQPISVIFTVPEDDLPQIMAQSRAGHASQISESQLQVVAFDRTNATQLAIGHVTTLDNQIDTTTGTVKLRAEFENSDEKLFPNQFVNARLLIKSSHDVVTVPTSAIQRGAPGTYVYVINADNTVSVRPIKVGPTDGEMAAVDSGLAPGNRVVIDGADRLRDGARVTIPGSPDQVERGAYGKEGAQPNGQPPNGAPSEHPHNNHGRQQGSE